MFAPGQIVRWLLKPLDAPPRCIYGIVEEVDPERVVIRIEGPDGAYWRRALPKRLFVIPEELITNDMKISKQFPTKYIKAVDLAGRNITLTIARVQIEKLGQGNQEEEKPVAYFNKTNKGLVLNATIARTIAALYGDETDEWGGKRITIFPTRVKAFGDTHDVVRVRPEIPAQQKPVPQAEAQVEENEIDDAEDVTDDHGYSKANLFDQDSEARS